jgi:hypothetical protein
MGSVGDGIEISKDVVQLLQSGEVAIWLATTNRECVPQTTRSMGARVHGEGRMLSLFVPSEQAARVLANAAPGAKLAVTFVRITDYRAVQVKAEIRAVRPCGDDERHWPEQYREAFVVANIKVGMDRELIAQMTYWPNTVVEVAVRELYAQTPGPNAGAPL